MISSNLEPVYEAFVASIEAMLNTISYPMALARVSAEEFLRGHMYGYAHGSLDSSDEEVGPRLTLAPNQRIW